ncbi:MAG: hypothetical protein HY262_13790 [Chloroflexi bacterium]|nr:hypothetical protein [Chloroflexota bacterium]
MPTLRAAVEIDRGKESAILVAAPSQASGFYISACHLIHGEARTYSDGASGGLFGPLGNAAVSVDQIVTVDGPPQEALLGGRVRAGVVRLVVTRATRTIVEATVVDGYYLAWWDGPADAVVIRALDASGTVLETINDRNGIITGPPEPIPGFETPYHRLPTPDPGG